MSDTDRDDNTVMTDPRIDTPPTVQMEENCSVNGLDTPDTTEETPMPSSEQEEEIIKKKYGGLLPKRPPLISKHHERAFFDSADWALRKQGAQKGKGPPEELLPKLQPTPQQQVRSRRFSHAPACDCEADEEEHSNPVANQSNLIERQRTTDGNMDSEIQDHFEDKNSSIASAVH